MDQLGFQTTICNPHHSATGHFWTIQIPDLPSIQMVTVIFFLQLAVHKLLDICDKHSVEMLAGILPVGRKDIFKHVTNEYRKYFKYTGKV